MFGSATRGDVLKNINLQYVRSLVGNHWAHALVTVRIYACGSMFAGDVHVVNRCSA